MTPLGPADFVSAWAPWPPGLVILALALVPYLWWWLWARRAGRPWPWWRALLYLTLGVGTLAYSVCGPLQVERTSRFWVAALQIGILACVTPVGLALGDPLRLARLGSRNLPRNRSRPTALVLRVLMFPAVSSVLAIGSLMAVFFTPYFAAAATSNLVEAVLVVHLVVTGLLFVLPLLVQELLPAWATPGIRALIAFGDGLLDAIPGIALMSTSALLAPGFAGFAGVDPDAALMDQRIGGGVLLVVSELIGLPLIAAVLVEWMRSDDREAREVDALLEEPAAGLWWQSDPRFADRYAARPPRDDGASPQKAV